MILDKMVEDGEYTAPEPLDNLQKAQSLALEYYAQGKLNKLEEKKLNLLRTFMKQIDVLLTLPPQVMPGPQVPGQMQPATFAPQANPSAPPVSPLLPNGPSSNLG